MIDEDGEGVRVAFMLSNCNDNVVLEVLLHTIKDGIGVLSPETQMEKKSN